MKKPINFILLGRSGSGKGTQAQFLKEHFKNLYYISSGNLFRGLMKTETQTAKKIKEIVDNGNLPGDEIATMLWMHHISFNVRENQGILTDGFPRRVQEAKNLDNFLDFLNRKEKTFVLLIDISRQEAFDRLTKRRICKECGQLIPWVGELRNIKVCNKCGGELISRVDDTPNAINNRMDYYEENVVPVVEYYEKLGRLIKIDGEQSIKDVFKSILKALGGDDSN